MNCSVCHKDFSPEFDACSSCGNRVNGPGRTYNMDYFRSEFLEFREILGSKEVMSNPEQRNLALKGFLHVWANLDVDDALHLESLVEANLREFNIRAYYADQVKHA